VWLAGGHLLAVAHAVADGADLDAGVVPAVDVVRAVADQDRPLFRDVQLVQDLEEHAGVRLEAVPVIPADDVGEVVRAQTLQDTRGVFQRLVGRDGLERVGEMIQHGFDAGIEARAVEAVGEIVPAEDPQRLFVARLVLLPDGEAKQTLDPVADEAEDLLLRALRPAQVPQREVDGRGAGPPASAMAYPMPPRTNQRRMRRCSSGESCAWWRVG